VTEYEPEFDRGTYPKVFHVDHVRVSRPVPKPEEEATP
jgi:hypothetical protein